MFEGNRVKPICMFNTQLKTVPAFTKNTLVKGIAFTGALLLLFQFQPFNQHQAAQAKPCNTTCTYASYSTSGAAQQPCAKPEQYKMCRPATVETAPAAKNDDSADMHLFSFPVLHTDMLSESVEEQPVTVREQYAFLPAIVRAARSLFGARTHIGN